MTHWTRFHELPTRRIVGLMSGTSVDAVDAALVSVSGTGGTLRLEEIVATTERPFSQSEAQRIHALFDGNVADICEMNVLIGEWFAEAALGVIEAAGLRPEDVHLIGSHGQTIYHIPRNPSGKDAGRKPSTLQIGSAAVIAERTGITTVADFRPRDMAAGGEGAPLVPYVDWALCRDPNRTIALQNIGGIANLTVVTPSLDGVLAFDTGPGNMVIDAAAAFATDGVVSYDRDGEIAASGEVDDTLLAELLAYDYFSIVPPKSTGREMWGTQLVRELSGRYSDPASRHDLVATMTELVARSIDDAYERFVLPHHAVEEVYVSGGGGRNPVLMRRLGELLAPVSVLDSSALGIPADAKEAIAFAILANETISGSPSNVPSATGAAGRRVLGHIVPGA